MATKLDLADAQLLGFYHGKRGYTLIDLVIAMGLTKREWLKMKQGYTLEYLSEYEIEEIEKYLTPSPEDK